MWWEGVGLLPRNTIGETVRAVRAVVTLYPLNLYVHCFLNPSAPGLSSPMHFHRQQGRKRTSRLNNGRDHVTFLTRCHGAATALAFLSHPFLCEKQCNKVRLQKDREESRSRSPSSLSSLYDDVASASDDGDFWDVSPQPAVCMGPSVFNTKGVVL